MSLGSAQNALPSAAEIPAEASFPWSPARPLANARAGWRGIVAWGLKIGDALTVSAAVILSFSFRVDDSFALSGFGSVPYWFLGVLTVLGWTVALGLAGSRSVRHLGAGLEEYRRVVTASLGLFGIWAIASYVLRASISRSLFVTALPLGVVLLLVFRWLVRQVIVNRRVAGQALVPTLLVGSASQITDILHSLNRHREAGYAPQGACVVGDGKASAGWGRDIVLHEKSELVAVASSGCYEAIIVGDGLSRSELRNLAWHLESSPIDLLFLPRLIDIAGPRLRVSDVEGLALMHVDLPRFSGWRLWLKRAFDIVFSGLALVALSPVFAVVAILIKMDDGGPVFFRQQRIGLRGQPIIVHKFRTMVVDAEAKIDKLIEAQGGHALLFKMEDDPRITGIGKILRKYSIDELPQFWSVLRGGMSVVGPRPQVAREVSEYTRVHYRRLLIKPGITGLWQINGRSELSLKESIRLDLRYVENWSLIGDIMIILKTIRVVLRPSGAY